MQHIGHRLMWLGCAALAAVLWRQVTAPGPSADLLAVWFAAEAFAQGQLDQVYFDSGGAFRMQAPAGWIPRAEALGFNGIIYPFVYPPLIAWLIHPLTEMTSAAAFVFWARGFYFMVLAGGVMLAARALSNGRRDQTAAFAMIGLALLCTSQFSDLALYEAQPQILVAFLMLLTVERSVAGRPTAAGAALAVAAAIKLFPAVFLVVLAAQKQWRGVLAFLVVGCALAGLSVLAAGWPLHSDFLAELRALNETALVTVNSYNLHALYYHTLGLPQVETVRGIAVGTAVERDIAWGVAKRPAVWAALGTGATLVAGVIAGRWILRNPATAVATWSALFTLSTLVMPMGWSYYYLAPMLLFPAVVRPLGRRLGGAVLAAFAISTSGTLAGLGLIGRHLESPLHWADPSYLPGMAAILVMAVLLLYAAWWGRAELSSPRERLASPA